MPNTLSSRECKTAHLLMGTSEFDRDSDHKKDYFKFWFAEGVATNDAKYVFGFDN